jgi:hypothetical protein
MARPANEEHQRQPHWVQCGAIRDCVADGMRSRETAHALTNILSNFGWTMRPHVGSFTAFHSAQICTEGPPAFGVQEMPRLGISAA